MQSHFSIYILLLLLVIFLIIGRREWLSHQRNLNRIPLRIIVNGTRGKSSVTRLISAGLAAGVFKVMAKTTGTKPRMILNNMQELPIVRLGKANIIEQVRIVKKTVSEGMDAIVFENMSIRPDLQWFEESKMIQPRIVVITNIRSDHLDVMGPTPIDVARNFINAIPGNCTVITAEQKLFPLMKALCEKRGIPIIQSSEDDISSEEMSGFSYFEHRENVALAAQVCMHLGLEKQLVMKGLHKSIPDPGALKRYELVLAGKNVELINALAANDPDSTYLIFKRLSILQRHVCILVNCRSDRIDRSLQLAELMSQRIPAEIYFATGANTMPFVRNMLSSGISRDRIVNLADKKVEDVVSAVCARIPDRSLIFAVGNIVGYGESLIACFLQRSGK